MLSAAAMDGGIKSLTIGADGVPVATRDDDGTNLPFHFLHFQGVGARPDGEVFVARRAGHSVGMIFSN